MIREQVSNYTKALDTGDLGLAARVWWGTKDVSAITPMGHSHGWEEVKGMYQFFADNFTDRHLQARDIAVHLMADAWVEYNWHFDAKIKANGMEIHSDGRESEVFRKIDGGWRIVHIHYSGPAMERVQAPGFSDPSRRLHLPYSSSGPQLYTKPGFEKVATVYAVIQAQRPQRASFNKWY